MSGYRFKAFLSYSHQDESIAAWLHRALETYRVPRRLVGSQGQFGSVQGKLSPVFRDREELSSATDLGDKITTALAESESLVVICSPASAQSQWVNEEIRHFRALGREDRIFSFIVDGDPQSEVPGESCFPPALLEHEDGLKHEPLAADIREWADGKKLAKLKLVAGILGIRLDKLRQRDLQRKRKLQAVAGFAIAAVVALAIFAFQKSLSEQQAREAREKARENAETMLSQFIEATESLEKTVDLQTRKTFNDLASNFLQNLNPDDLTLESKRNLGRILQKQGETSYSEGQYQLAFNFFIESKAVLTSIYEENPGDQQAIFDLSQVEYYIGRLHFFQGRYSQAHESFSAYRDASENLIRIDPDNADWVMEMAYASSNLGYLERHRDPPNRQKALEFYQDALNYVERATQLDESRRSEMSDFNADLADAHLDICDLPGALLSRQQAADLAEQFYLADPANNRLKLLHAFTLAGWANVQQLTGDVEPALVNLQKSVDLLNRLYLEDPTRMQYRWNLLAKSGRAAYLMSLTGRLDEAWNWYLRIENQGQKLIEDDREITLRQNKYYADFLIHFSETSFRYGKKEKAESLLDKAAQHLQTTLNTNPKDHESMALQVLLNFNRWVQSNNVSDLDGTTIERVPGAGSKQLQSCKEINLSVLQALMSGDLDSAKEYSSLLLTKGYSGPEFIQLCSEYDICKL